MNSRLNFIKFEHPKNLEIMVPKTERNEKITEK